MEENAPKIREDLNLNPEQAKILAEAENILSDAYFMSAMGQRSVIKFDEKLRKKSFDSVEYILWQKLIYSSPDDRAKEFDTQNRDVEKFIGELKKHREKFNELLNIINSLIGPLTNSDEAFELRTRIDGFYDDFLKNKINLKDYLFGRMLLSPKNLSVEPHCEYYDTEDGKIEKFIRNLQKLQEE